MIESRKMYAAPAVKFMKFDAKDVLATSGWNFNCQTSGEGFNAEPPECSVDVTTDNSQN